MTAVPIVVVVVALGVLLTFVATTVWFVRAAYRRVAAHEALVITRSNGPPVVSFVGRLVLPVVQRAEIMDLRAVPVVLRRVGADGMRCKDGVRLDVELEVALRVGRTHEDVLAVAEHVGCARAADPDTVAELFMARIADATKTAISARQVEEALGDVEAVADAIREHLGAELGGWEVDRLRLRATLTARDAIDDDNILDAPGREKLDRLIAADAVPPSWWDDGRSSAASSPAFGAHADHEPGSPALVDQLLPAPVDARAWRCRATIDGEHARVRVDVGPPRVVLESGGEVVVSLRLDGDLRVRIGRAIEGRDTQVVLELERAVAGAPLRLVLRAAGESVWAAIRRDASTPGLDVLPRVSARGAEIGGEDMVALMAMARGAGQEA